MSTFGIGIIAEQSEVNGGQNEVLKFGTNS